MFLVSFEPGSVGLAAGAFLLLMVPLVLIHELGHLLAAKALGIRVVEFGIGLPPRVKRVGWTMGGTLYSVNWLPIGGFVRLFGENDPSDPRSFAAAAAWKRGTVMLAGVAMNFLVAVVVITVAFMVPRERALSLAQVYGVTPGSPAATATVSGEMGDGTEPAAGLQPGDVVVSIEGREVGNISELLLATRLNLGTTQNWVVNRQGSRLVARVYARWSPPAGEGPTGVSVGPPLVCTRLSEAGDCTFEDYRYPYTESVAYGPWRAMRHGVSALGDSMLLGKNEIEVRIRGGGGSSPTGPVVQGPVGIAAVTGDIIKEAGWRPVIEIIALMSLNLGLFNALPIPMLDGGKLSFILLEMVRRGRRVGARKEALVHIGGFVLMLGGVAVMTFFDVARLVS